MIHVKHCDNEPYLCSGLSTSSVFETLGGILATLLMRRNPDVEPEVI